jgi:hypothetical protein
MAGKEKGAGDVYVSKENIRVNGGPVIAAAQGFDGVSYEKGYPSIANADMHNNQGKAGEKLRGSRRD